MAGYDAVDVATSSQVYLWVGIVGSVIHFVTISSYLVFPQLKTQHPSANLMVWHVACNFMLTIGFVGQHFLLFFILGSGLWYMMLSLDLLIALINPWMGYAIKTWAYHTITWSISSLSAASIYSLHLYGVSSLNICWIRRTLDAREPNDANWIFLFGPVLAVWFVSFAVLLFATFRFARRQMDSTYRSKRRSLLQYFRYLIMYGAFWVVCGGLYYSAYLRSFSGRSAHHIELAFMVALGSYPLLVGVVWGVNTDLLTHLQGGDPVLEPNVGLTEHFSTSLRKDLMNASARSDEFEDGGTHLWYAEKKRLATTVRLNTSKLQVYYDKLGFTDYAPRVFANLRAIAGIDPEEYESSFVGTLSEIASEGKSGMLFYFTSDRRYIVKTMTKDEHAFLLRMLPSYHAYVRTQPSTLLCRFLGCHSMQLPVGWDKMFFVVMENVLSTHHEIDDRYDLKGLFAPVLQPPLRVFLKDDQTARLLSPPQTATKQLWHDHEFVARGTYLNVASTVRLELLTQMTSDIGFLQEMDIMDYSCIVGIREFDAETESTELLPKNAIVSADAKKVYYLGFIDILQSYGLRWKVQNLVLSLVRDKRTITALPPPEYALRFLSFLHAHLLRSSADGSASFKSMTARSSFNYGTL
ncbi:hypothetical protein DYB25_005077 [Aphanomyces astaci]|uniref:PIPK domain-containing protein n=1 Tax=Aphanomyces astaci TaxID=112090 RepID=A0A397D6R9_APHAT|nr:hypothetical protein DYB36_006165 [Aphanomyces astaci]RHY23907.1 hypothetical protein DYB25_005077 [Aphanomyces astaci]RHY54768.1 hypothetical protein DYB34_003180 [Aphanomyces astaci]RHY57152.1 hypothetical protein DYB30_005432 [Aphanomyces astaci]RHY59795.1 hypothetical protein DYB38_004234 [Aphanomyces astaci]